MGYDVPPGFRQVDAQSFCHAVVDGTHASPKQAAAGRRLVTSKHIKNGRVDLSTAYLISEADFQEINRRSRVDQWDVIFTMIGTIGESALVVDEAPDFAIKNVGLFKSRDELSGRWLYYFLQAPEARAELDHRKKGSTQQYISLGDLRSFPLLVPLERDTTQSIVSILQSFDDRIDLLRQTNVTLEAIAQALFKSWFVDFDPVRAKAEGREPEGMDAATANLFSSELEDSELGGVPWGWKVQSLGSVAGNLREQAKPELLDPDTPYVGLEHMPRKSIALMDRGDAEGLASGKFWYSPCDILFGRLRPYFHKVGVAAEKGICSTDILVVRPHQPEWFGYCVGQFSSDALIAYATQVSNGARMPRVGWKDLAAYKVVTPPHDVAAAFDRLVRPMITRIHQNIEHARTLANVRDTLLPRLISGKLRLPNAEHEIEAATA